MGEIERTRRRIGKLRAALETGQRELAAAERYLADLQRLRVGERDANVFSEHMTPEARAARNLRISEGRAPSNAFLKACRKAGISQNQLAEDLDISPGSLVAYRNGRAIPERLAKVIEARIGFSAWPGGIERD